MRNLSSAVAILLLGFSFGCNNVSPDARGSTLPLETPLRPDLIQYSEDINLSWNARNSVATWRSEVDDLRPAGPVHIVSEAVCPDRYRVTTSGSDESISVYIGRMKYQRKGDGAWVRQTMHSAQPTIPFCSRFVNVSADSVKIRLVAEEMQNISLSKPIIRQIAGRECREWSRTFVSGKDTLVSTNCFDIHTHELVQSHTENTVATYYWDPRIDIKAPI